MNQYGYYVSIIYSVFIINIQFIIMHYNYVETRKNNKETDIGVSILLLWFPALSLPGHQILTRLHQALENIGVCDN